MLAVVKMNIPPAEEIASGTAKKSISRTTNSLFVSFALPKVPNVVTNIDDKPKIQRRRIPSSKVPRANCRLPPAGIWLKQTINTERAP